jgi:DNA polymerase-3 subunit epsilon
MVAQAPSFGDIFPQIEAALKDKIAIVYNADYDIALLGYHAQRYGFETWFCEEDWCLMKAYARHWGVPKRRGGDYQWQKLADACQQQNVVLEEAHRAMGDTLATYALLKKLAELP